MRIKNILIEIIVSIICISLITFILVKQTKNNKPTNLAGEIEFVVIDKNNKTVICDKLSYLENDTLFGLLDRTYTLEYDNGIYGHTIYSINGYNTDFINSYFSILINGEYATSGVDGINLINGVKIEFVWQEIN